MSVGWFSQGFSLPMSYTAVFTEAAFHAALDEIDAPKDGRPAWMKTSHANATAHSFECRDGKEDVIVALCVKDGVSGVQIAGLLVHEAVHIFQWCCDYWGETRPSKEFEAYSIQQISQNLMQQYTEFLTTKEAHEQ